MCQLEMDATKLNCFEIFINSTLANICKGIHSIRWQLFIFAIYIHIYIYIMLSDTARLRRFPGLSGSFSSATYFTFYGLHFSINLITQRFVIIGA